MLAFSNKNGVVVETATVSDFCPATEEDKASAKADEKNPTGSELVGFGTVPGSSKRVRLYQVTKL